MWYLGVISLINFASFRADAFSTLNPIKKGISMIRKASTASLMPDQSDFKELLRLEERCSRLSTKEVDYLSSFWSNELNCFQIIPQLNSSRVSITTTCLSLESIFNNPESWKDTCKWEDEGQKIVLKKVFDALLETPWSNNPFQTPVLVLAFSRYKSLDKDHPKFIEAVNTLLSQRSKLSLHRSQEQGSYLRYLNVKALLSIVETECIPSELQGSNSIGYALERASMVAFDELCRQIAFSEAEDSANFDVIILVYSLLTYFETSQSLFLTSFARGVVPATNMKLVKKALAIIFRSQSVDGTWRKGEPIFVSGTERDIGNSYVFFLDFVASFLETFGQSDLSLLTPYLENLERCTTWVENNILQEMLPDETDPVSLRKRGRLVQGWRSNHLGTGGAVCWSTAQVFMFVTTCRKFLKKLITSSVLEEFGGRMAETTSRKDWESLMDADVIIDGEVTTLKQVLEVRLLNPMVKKECNIQSNLLPPSSRENSSPCGIFSEDENVLLRAMGSNYKPSYSLILFGPPGTAKTSTCTSIANFLGWNFVTIDTAAFLAQGLQNVASRMTYIFDRLRSLERTIILFDEIEEFCMDRTAPSTGMESRLLTTAMLTQLNDLRRQQSSVFIVATNRLRAFDAAVTRPGRFDLLLFAGTPNAAARRTRLKKALGATSLTVEQQDHALKVTDELVGKRKDEMRFLSFAEGEALGRTVLDQAMAGTLTLDTLNNSLNNLLRTATIQGSVKEDYIASETLSRL